MKNHLQKKKQKIHKHMEIKWYATEEWISEEERNQKEYISPNENRTYKTYGMQQKQI